jgi:hypothetical protein
LISGEIATIGTNTKGRILPIVWMKEKDFGSMGCMAINIFGICFQDSWNKPMRGSLDKLTGIA